MYGTALAADLKQFFGVLIDDVWAGRFPVGRAVEFAEQAKNIPDSRIRALWLGGIEFLGWGTEQYALANLYDLIHAFALGIGGKSLRKSDRYPRPEIASPQSVVKKPTLADFDIDAFMAKIAGS